MALVDVAHSRTWRWFRNHLYGLPADSRTAQWIAAQSPSRQSTTGVLSSPDEVAAFVGIPFAKGELEDA